MKVKLLIFIGKDNPGDTIHQEIIKIINQKIKNSGLSAKVAVVGEGGSKDLYNFVDKTNIGKLQKMDIDPDAITIVLSHSYYLGRQKYDSLKLEIGLLEPISFYNNSLGKKLNLKNHILFTCAGPAIFNDLETLDKMNLLAVGGTDYPTLIPQSLKSMLHVIDLIALNKNTDEIFAEIAKTNPEPMSFLDKETGLITKLQRPGKVSLQEIAEILDETLKSDGIKKEDLPNQETILDALKSIEKKDPEDKKANKEYFRAEAVTDIIKKITDNKFEAFYLILQKKLEEKLSSKAVMAHLEKRSKQLLKEKKEDKKQEEIKDKKEQKEGKIRVDDDEQVKQLIRKRLEEEKKSIEKKEEEKESEKAKLTEFLFYIINRISKKQENEKTAFTILKQNPQLINATDSRGRSLLMQAAIHKCDAIVNYLIDAGADLSASNNPPSDLRSNKMQYGETILIYAAKNDDSKLVKNIITTANKNKKGIGINSQDKDGYTALMHAAKNGDVEMVRILLENNANPILSANDDVTTALSIAKSTAKEEIIEMLDKAISKYHKSREIRREVVQYWLEKTLKNEIAESKKEKKKIEDQEQKEEPEQKAEKSPPKFTLYDTSVSPEHLDTNLILQGIWDNINRSGPSDQRDDFALFTVSTNKNTHACAVIIDLKQEKIFFIDPEGNPIPKEIIIPLKRLFGKYQIISTKNKQQSDLANCELYTRRNILNFIKGLITIDDLGNITGEAAEIDIYKELAEYAFIEEEYNQMQHQSLSVEGPLNRKIKSDLRDNLNKITSNEIFIKSLNTELQRNLYNLYEELRWETGVKEEKKENLVKNDKKAVSLKTAKPSVPTFFDRFINFSKKII